MKISLDHQTDVVNFHVMAKKTAAIASIHVVREKERGHVGMIQIVNQDLFVELTIVMEMSIKH